MAGRVIAEGDEGEDSQPFSFSPTLTFVQFLQDGLRNWADFAGKRH